MQKRAKTVRTNSVQKSKRIEMGKRKRERARKTNKERERERKMMYKTHDTQSGEKKSKFELNFSNISRTAPRMKLYWFW